MLRSASDSFAARSFAAHAACQYNLKVGFTHRFAPFLRAFLITVSVELALWLECAQATTAGSQDTDVVDLQAIPPSASDIELATNLQSRPTPGWLLGLAVVLSVFCASLLYRNWRMARENLKLLDAEQRLVDMTEQLRTGVFQVRHYENKPLVVEFTNEATRRMARLSHDEGVDCYDGFIESIHPEDRESVKLKIRESLATRRPFSQTFRFDFPNDEQGWVLADAHCRIASDGANIWSGYLVDLTSERLLREELNELLVSRNEFMTSAGHELRTPLQALSISLHVLSGEQNPARSSHLLETARKATHDLIELVDDFVEISCMNSRPLTLSHESYDCHEIFEGLARTFSNVANKRALAFNYSIDRKVPRAIWGDPLRVKQIIYNLLGNAFKYTDSGSVSFHVRACHYDTVKQPDDSGIPTPVECMEIVIRDTGRGIPANLVPSIFEPFSTLCAAGRDSNGLGLAIVDKLAAIMGGYIRVDTEENVGSEFVVHLPISTQRQRLTVDRQAVRRVTDDSWNVQSSNLLVVDDNPLVRETLASLLELDGWQVLQAESAMAALALLEHTECVAIVTDQHMPEMSGIDLAQKVLEHSDSTGNRPVMIMMSGGMERRDAHRANDLFDAVLLKPIKPSQIRSAIESITAMDTTA